MEERRKRVRKVIRKRKKKPTVLPQQESLPTILPQMPTIAEEPQSSQAIMVPETMPMAPSIFPVHLFPQIELIPIVPQSPMGHLPQMPQVDNISELLASMSHLAQQMGQNAGPASASVSMRWENGQMISTDMKVNCGGQQPPQPASPPKKFAVVKGSPLKNRPKKKVGDDLWAIGFTGAALGMLAYSLIEKSSKKGKKSNPPNPT